MNPYAGAQRLIGNESPSMTRGAVYQRVRRLTNEAFSDAVDASNRKSKNKRKQKALIKKNEFATCTVSHSKAMEDRVRFHLSRGRDAADIVTREGIKASIILAIVAKIKAEAQPTP